MSSFGLKYLFKGPLSKYSHLMRASTYEFGEGGWAGEEGEGEAYNSVHNRDVEGGTYLPGLESHVELVC